MSKRTWAVLPVAMMLVAGMFAGQALAAAPGNDMFAAATVISGTRILRAGDTNEQATIEGSEPVHAGVGNGGSVWYSWTPAVSGPTMVNTSGSDFDTVLGVYTGSAVSGLTEVASNDDEPGTDLLTSRLHFNAVAATNYHIAVSAYGPDTGTIRLRLYEGPTSTERVSLTEGDLEINNNSWITRDADDGTSTSSNVVDSDGSVVAFASTSGAIVATDGGVDDDIFVRDLTAGTTTWVSPDTTGTDANGDSWGPSIAGDGNLVSFASDSTDLVAVDTNGWDDVFLRNISGATTTRVSVDTGGGNANDFSGNPSISSDGTKVAFESWATDVSTAPAGSGASNQVYVRDLSGATTQMVSITPADAQGGNDSYDPVLNSDGTKVAFESDAANLLGAGADTNGSRDIFLRNTSLDTMVRASVDSNEVEANNDSFNPSISADGTKVAFESDASNLVASDTNGSTDIFVRDVTAGTTSRVSIRSNGVQQIQGKDNSYDAFISPDGRYVVFSSDAPNLVPGDTNGRTDIFLHDLATGFTSRVSVQTGGDQASGWSDYASLSSDGDIVWAYTGGDLAPIDTNGSDDIYMRTIGFQVDALIKGPKDGSYAGDGVYAAVAPASQSKLVKAAKGSRVSFNIQIENDGSVSDRFNVIGCAKSAGYSVAYTVGNNNVTSLITTTGYHPAAIGPGDSKTIGLTIKLSKKATKSKVCTVTATSDTDLTKVDQVKATVKALKR